VNLDDLDGIAAVDPGAMLATVGQIASHVERGHAAGREAADLPEADGIVSIALCGMGGSAVGGDVVRALYGPRLGVPIEVVRSPVLPEFCETHTLVVCSSYSGDTAETLAAFEEAARRGCRLIAVTSGGEMARRANELGVPVVPAPAGFQPRAALGFLTMGLLGALEAVGVVPALSADVVEAVAVLRSMAEDLGPERSGNPAKALALRIGDRTPVIWGADGLGAVAAMRWKTQFNENGKVPAWWSTMSELDHNEIAAWAHGMGERYFLIALRHPGEDPSISPRFPLSIAIAADAGMEVAEIHAQGRSPLAHLLSLVTMGDHVSVYLALAHDVDPTPVDVIQRLKRELA
jgi:glucose/mannose-6-phosphate isomerase